MHNPFCKRDPLTICTAILGRCPSTVLRVALGRALIYEGNETVLGTNPNRTHDQPKPYLETAETVLDLYSDKGMFAFLLRGAHKKNSLKIDAFPFSNRILGAGLGGGILDCL